MQILLKWEKTNFLEAEIIFLTYRAKGDTLIAALPFDFVHFGLLSASQGAAGERLENRRNEAKTIFSEADTADKVFCLLFCQQLSKTIMSTAENQL